MDPKSELKALQAKNSALIAGVKSSGRNLSEAEVADLDRDANRIMELKAVIERAERQTAEMRRFAEAGPAEVFVENEESAKSWRGASTETKGYLSPTALKRLVRTGGAEGAKAFVAPGSTTSGIVLDDEPVKLGRPSANLGLLNVIPVTRRADPRFSYLRQTVRTNNAAVVEPGAEKPKSIITLVSVDNKLEVLAHESEYIDKYVLRDGASLEQFVENELTFGLIQKLSALGVAAFVGVAGTTTQAFQGNVMDSIYLGATKAWDLGYDPNVVLLSRADYDAIALAKDSTGSYLYRTPDDSRLHGLEPIIVTGLPAKTALVLDSERVGISTDTLGLVYEWDTVTRKSFNESNLLVEGRFAFNVYSPASIVKVGTAA